jgi:hypothetical protein
VKKLYKNPWNRVTEMYPDYTLIEVFDMDFIKIKELIKKYEDNKKNNGEE